MVVPRLFVLDGRLALRFARAADRFELIREALAEGRTRWEYAPGMPETDLYVDGVRIHHEDHGRHVRRYEADQNVDPRLLAMKPFGFGW